MSTQVFVVLPAFNEEDALPRLLTKLAALYAETKLAGRVIVVDDGSRDRTGEVAGAWGPPVELVAHAQNRGLGAAIRTGLAHAAHLAAADDVIVTMDADDTHIPGLIPRMVATLGEGYDVVIASRYQPGSRTLGVSPLRQFLSWGAGWLFRVALPMSGVRDYTSGFRAYRARIVQRAFARWGDQLIDRNDFSSMPRLLLRLRRLGAIAVEVPMVLRYDLKPGVSKMRVGRNVLANVALIWQELRENRLTVSREQ
jgi:dolichol-phosphate mannosyltransferase